jgi:hypothetical protein
MAEVRTGAAALADWKADAPGVRRHIKLRICRRRRR